MKRSDLDLLNQQKEVSPFKTDERYRFIETVKTPLGFFALVVFMVEGLFFGLLLSLSGAERTLLLFAVVGTLILVVFVVAGIAAWKPEALWSKRYSALEESFAQELGEEIHTTLDIHLSTLSVAEREKACELLRQMIMSSPHARSGVTRKFCEILSETIIRRATLKGKWQRANGGKTKRVQK